MKIKTVQWVTALCVVAAGLAGCSQSPRISPSSMAKVAASRCQTVGTLAFAAMILRQGGKPIESAYGIPTYAFPDLTDVVHDLVKTAYRTPIRDTEEEKRETVDGFKTEAVNVCRQYAKG